MCDYFCCFLRHLFLKPTVNGANIPVVPAVLTITVLLNALLFSDEAD
jgi:hypothetical protein